MDKQLWTLSRNMHKLPVFVCTLCRCHINLPGVWLPAPTPPPGWFLAQSSVWASFSFLTSCFCWGVHQEAEVLLIRSQGTNGLPWLELRTVCPHSHRENWSVQLHTPKLWLGSFLLPLVNKHDQDDLATLEHKDCHRNEFAWEAPYPKLLQVWVSSFQDWKLQRGRHGEWH